MNSITGKTFTVTFKEKFWKPWFKPSWPIVTNCCASLNWVNAISEDGKRVHDVCMDCHQITTVDFMTVEQYNKTYTLYPFTKDQFEGLWAPKNLAE